MDIKKEKEPIVHIIIKKLCHGLQKKIIRDSNYLGNPLYYKHTEIPKEQAERGDYFYECAVL